jgi:hypothetical protein
MANILTFIASGRVIVDSVVAGNEQQVVIVGPNGPIGQLAGQLNSTIDVAVAPAQSWTLKAQHRLANGSWEDGQVRLGTNSVVNGVPTQIVECERDLSGGDFRDLVLRVQNATATTTPAPQPQPPGVLPACGTPDARTTPEFRMPFRHPLLLAKVLELNPSSPPASPPLPVPQLACAVVSSLDASVIFDPRFEQVWTLQKLAIGDLASTLSLSPLERLVTEIKTSQRTTFERSAVESSESLESSEATLHDTETVNVARSNTTTTNWHVDGQGSVSGPLGSTGLTGTGSLGGGYSKNVTDTSQYSQNRLSERTQKSAQSLKSLHKIEIKGASESIVQDRQLRILRNPYRDRALALNFFQLLKHFSVTTSFVESRLGIAIRVADVVMDQAFVLANVEFLETHLIDAELKTNLPFAVAGARSSGSRSNQTPATLAQKALQFLFKNPPNIFNLPSINGIQNPNDPATSYDASVTAPPSQGASAFDDVLFSQGADDNRPFAKIFFTLNFYYRLALDPTLDPFTNGENAIQLAVSLYNAINDDWQSVTKANIGAFKNLLDNKDRTEGIRRVAGFLAMVGKMLIPLIASVTTSVTPSTDPTKPDEVTTLTAFSDEETPKQRNSRILDALIAHLGCNKNYYIQRFLEYQARRTRGQAIVDFATDIWGRVVASSAAVNGIRAEIVEFDVDAAFVDKQHVIIPDRALSQASAPTGLTPAQLVKVGQKLGIPESSPPAAITFPAPTTFQIQVPADGVHLEVSGGACILNDVPDKPFVEADFNFGPSSIKISEE